MQPQASSESSALRAELPNSHHLITGSVSLSLLFEFKKRRSLGERITAREFLRECSISPDSDTIVDIAFAEYLDEERCGSPSIEERLVLEFPEWAVEIRHQIAFHQALIVPNGNPNADPQFETSDSVSTNCGEGSKLEDDLFQQRTDIPGLNFLRTLGRGGMGVVYLAKQPALNRLVAVKFLLGGTLSSLAHRARFRAEAQAAAALRHSNIVQIFEVGEAGGQPFLIMEFVSGGSLDEYLRENTPSACDSAAFVQTVALAFHQAHQHGIVHRDLKPGNILLALYECVENKKAGLEDAGSFGRPLADWSPKIADFGLAKIMGDEPVLGGPTLTLAGDILGTPCYMAPEQINFGLVGPWTDVYALGAILYQLLSGRLPFQSTSPWETMQQVLEQDPPPLPRKVPNDLRTICMKCLKKQPSARYTSMNLLATDIENWFQGRPILARRTTKLELVSSWCRRNRTVATLGSIVLFALSSILGITLWGSSRIQQLLSEAQQSRRSVTGAHLESQNNLWESLISKARAQQRTGYVGQRTDSLAVVSEAKTLLESVGATPERMTLLRDTTATCMTLPDIEKKADLQGLSTSRDARYSADSSLDRIAQLDAGRVIVSEDFGAKRIVEFETPGAKNLRLSPDGKFLAVWNDECSLYDLRKSDLAVIAKFPSNGYWGFSAASDKLIGSERSGVIVVDIESGKIEHRFGNLQSRSQFAFSIDNQRAAFVTPNSLVIVDIQRGLVLREFAAPTTIDGGSCLSWHPDSKRIAAGKYGDNKVVLWDIESAKMTREYAQNPDAFFTIGFDKTGQNLIVSSPWAGRINVFDTETEKLILESHGNTHGDITSGQNECPRLMLNSWLDQFSVHQFRPQRVLQTFQSLSGPRHEKYSAATSLNGQWLAVSTDRGVELFRNSSRHAVTELPVGRPSHDRVIFDHSQRLWVCRENGWLRWQIGEAAANKLDFLPSSTGFMPIEVNHDGTWALVTDGWNIKLESLSGPKREIVAAEQQQDVRTASFSGDGRFVVTGGWNGNGGAKVWSMEQGSLVTSLETGPNCVTKFSPDSRWLLTSPRGGELWDTTTWKPVLHLNSTHTSTSGFAFGFSPDSSRLAVSDSNGIVQLWDLASGAVAGELRYPYHYRANWIGFSQDQNELVCVSANSCGAVQYWDLGVLKNELSELGIDYPSFAIQDVQKEKDMVKNDRICSTPFTVESSEFYETLVAKQLVTESTRTMEKNDWMHGLELLREARKISPHDATILNNLAWALLTGPIEFRDPSKSLEYALEAVREQKSNFALNTLGTAQYRCSEIHVAIETLTECLADGSRINAAYNYYLLACCHAKLDQFELAEEFYAKGTASQKHQEDSIPRSWIRELTEFRAEAELCLADSKARKLHAKN